MRPSGGAEQRATPLDSTASGGKAGVRLNFYTGGEQL